MYTEEGDMRLAEVFVKLHQTGNAPSPKDDPKTQRNYLVQTIKLDSERVYDSDIKKLLTWYHLVKELIDISTLLTEETPAESAEEAPKKAAKKSAKKAEAETEGTEEKPKKVAAKKTAAKKTAAKTAAAPKATKVSSKSTANTNRYRPKSV